MKLQPFDSTYFMRQALIEAEKAFAKGEVPIGAVIVSKDKIIARAHNLTETLNDVTAHAEMQAITAAADYIGGKYLKDCDLYVTVEPCQMCAGALYWAQVKNIFFGATDTKRGCTILGTRLHPKTQIQGGLLEEECTALMQDFFRTKRK